MRRMVALCALMAPGPAFAFGGALVGGDGSSLASHYTEVVYTRVDDHSVVTVSPNVQGATGAPFGLILPVPGVLGEGGVTVVDPAHLAAIDAYSSPHPTDITCDDLNPFGGDTGYRYYYYYYYDTHELGLFGYNRGPGFCGCRSDWSCGTDVPQRGVDPNADDDGNGGTTGPQPPRAARNNAGDTGDTDPGISVADDFALAEYDITVLGADSGGDLGRYLAGNGWVVSPELESRLDVYARLGWTFVVATVATDDLPADGAMLTPLQLAFDTEVMVLPLRLGTAGDDGAENDLVVQVINDITVGRAAITNYPREVIADECMLPEEVSNFDIFYADYAHEQLRRSGDTVFDDTADTAVPVDSDTDVPADTDVADTDVSADTDTDVPVDTDVPADTDPPPTGHFEYAAWDQEFGFPGGGCDPCGPGGRLSPDTFVALGWTGDPRFALVTRLRFAYTAGAIDQDPVLYNPGSQDPVTLEFVNYLPELESDFPICGQGWTPNAQSCFDTRAARRKLTKHGRIDGVALGFVGLLGLIALRRRHRVG
jgi:hypothetical protein